MKQLTVICFSLYYLFAVSGVAVNYHYCGRELASAAFYGPGIKPCSCGAEEKTAGCCHNSVKLLKTEDSVKPAVASWELAWQGDSLPAEAADLPAWVSSFPAGQLSSAAFIFVGRRCGSVALYRLFQRWRN
jgi:hypothetical protein